MKKILLLIITVALCVLLLSCTAPSELYGAWYVDYLGTRNAIQFSENADGDDVFIWAVYNIEEDSIESNSSGYYYIDGDTITFEYSQDADPLILSFELEGNSLTLSSDTATLKLEKFELEE